MAADNIIRPDAGEAKRLHKAALHTVGILEKAAAENEKRRLAAIAALKKLRIEQASTELAAMDVSCLSAEKSGIRVAALREAGIDNMQQLSRLSESRLRAIDGIGEQSAKKIVGITKNIVRQVLRGCHVRISLDDMTAAQTELLTSVRACLALMPSSTELTELYRQYYERLKNASTQVSPALGGLKWMLADKAKRSTACSALAYLRKVSENGSIERIGKVYEQWTKLAAKPLPKLPQDFEARSAEYYAYIESLDPDAVDKGKNGLPEEIVTEAECRVLHLDGLNATLRGYQSFGTKYILSRKASLLGDEMGLGKTVQAIAAMVSLKNEGAERFMVVCPASVLVNWSREIQKFSPLDVTVIRGGDEAALESWCERGGVAVTTYESISRYELPDWLRLDLLTVDEAHYVKNPDAKRSRALSKLLKASERSLFMTGTPLENRVDEMCVLLKSLDPAIGAEAERMKYMSAAPQFKELVAPVYLRRTREDVLQELPELVEKEEWCTLLSDEKKTYRAAVKEGNFMTMRQVSWLEEDAQKSSKAQRLLELCELAREDGRRVIVFSFFRNTIARVCSILSDRCMEPITGSVSPQRRQEIVDEFSKSPDGSVLVCQVQAGGTGINIQAASVIIFCEPQIKPSIENQAISRAYRMGQVHSVLVHRLLCDDTVDERILEMLAQKQEVFDSFADESAVGSQSLDSDASMAAQIIAAERERLGEEAR